MEHEVGKLQARFDELFRMLISIKNDIKILEEKLQSHVSGSEIRIHKIETLWQRVEKAERDINNTLIDFRTMNATQDSILLHNDKNFEGMQQHLDRTEEDLRTYSEKLVADLANNVDKNQLTIMASLNGIRNDLDGLMNERKNMLRGFIATVGSIITAIIIYIITNYIIKA